VLGSATLDALFWFYFMNAILLIVHEIDSAYWKEWELFKLRGGITGFLIIHFNSMVHCWSSFLFYAVCRGTLCLYNSHLFP
jgi:hypothetical protein